MALPLCVGLVVAAMLCLGYGVAAVYMREPPLPPRMDPPAVGSWWLNHATQWGTESAVAAWFFVLGGCFGSFLNVVVYRLPRGQTLLGHSQCPYCQTPIRVIDNIPVWGWIRRHGRCFHCRLPISVRYPLVELTMAFLCLILATLEIPLQGVHLFGTLQPRQVGFVTTLLEWQPEGMSRFVMHFTLLATLLACAWIRFDRQRIPWGLVTCGMAVTLAVSAGVPTARAWQQPTSLTIPGVMAIQSPVVMNVAGGALIGIVWWSLWQRDGLGNLWLHIYLGGTLGIAAALATLFGTRIVCPRSSGERSATPPGPLFVATALVLSSWWLVSFFGWSGSWGVSIPPR